MKKNKTLPQKKIGLEGFVAISAMIALGILTFGVYGVSQFFEWANKTNQISTENGILNSLQARLRTIIQYPDTCKQALRSSVGQPFSVLNNKIENVTILDPSFPNQISPLYAPNDRIDDTHLQIQSIDIFFPDAPMINLETILPGGMTARFNGTSWQVNGTNLSNGSFYINPGNSSDAYFAFQGSLYQIVDPNILSRLGQPGLNLSDELPRMTLVGSSNSSTFMSNAELQVEVRDMRTRALRRTIKLDFFAHLDRGTFGGCADFADITRDDICSRLGLGTTTPQGVCDTQSTQFRDLEDICDGYEGTFQDNLNDPNNGPECGFNAFKGMPGASCTSTAECATGSTCINGACSGTASCKRAGMACVASLSNGCCSNQCVGGVCSDTKLRVGDPCTSNAQCASQVCSPQTQTCQYSQCTVANGACRSSSECCPGYSCNQAQGLCKIDSVAQ